MSSNISDCWRNFAAAIIDKGIKEHDTAFLKSDWCSDLKALAGINVTNNDMQPSQTLLKVFGGIDEPFSFKKF